MMTSKAVIEQLQSEVALLHSELAATKARLARQSEQAVLVSASSPTSYTAAAASQVPSNQGRQQPRRNHQKPQCQGRPTAKATSSHSSTLTEPRSTSTNLSEAVSQSARVKVEGARRIWGTHPHATTRTVANAIERFCKLQELRV